jgi:ABC-2 type transport system ATP-binding protein
MRAMIRRFAAAGTTVLLSSHLLAEVQQVCDRVGVIAQGRLVADTTVARLREGALLRVAADPLPLARQTAASLAGVDRVAVSDGLLEVDVPRDRAGQVNAALVAAGVEVSELRWAEPDLESLFFTLTGGNDAGHAAR